MQGAPLDDDARDREALRSALPRPTPDAADTLLAALHRSRLAAALFGEGDEVTVDRYILRRELGRGGMGVVFVAEDPILAVPVALKLLQRGHTSGDESQLQREAQALARVRGDHVVRVYSAGFFMGQPWIAMQLVDGPHLGEWAKARDGAARPPWRETLARYVEAGRGLQAIHAAGLVHRDFKPQNAVVDADGCVKVLDFGLATAATARGDDAEPRLGTHRYAAPEQFLGRDLDPRSDQFSFCVALHEALAGDPPFGPASSTGERLAADPTTKVPRLTNEFPRWLAAAVQRGLATRPEDRHPDMAALLRELTRDRLRGLRITALVGAGFLAGILAIVLLARAGPDERCTAIVTDAWDEQRTTLALPPDALARLDAAVTSWRDRWLASRGSLCQTRPRPDADSLTARHACLVDAHALFTDVLTRAPTQPSLLGDALVHLRAPESCLDLAPEPALPDPPSPELVARIDAELRDAEAAHLYADPRQARERLLAARDLCARAHDPRLAARVELALAVVARETGDRRLADEALRAALDHTDAIDDTTLAAEILHERTRLELLRYRSPEDGQRSLTAASIKLQRLPANVSDAHRSLLLAEHHDLRGLLYSAARDFDPAIAEHAAAVDIYRQKPPRSDVQRRLHETLLHRADAHAGREDLHAAIADTNAALAIAIELHGPDHPGLADTYRGLARDHAALGQRAEARAAAERARALLRGRDPGDEARSLHELATLERDSGDLLRAEALAREAVELATRDPDSEAADLSNHQFLLATLAFATDAPDTSQLLQRAAASLAGVQGPEAACDRAYLQSLRALHAVRHDQLAIAEDLVSLEPPDACGYESLRLWVRAQIAAKRDDFTAADAAYTAALKLPSEHHAAQQKELARLLRRHRPGDPRIAHLEAAPEAPP